MMKDTWCFCCGAPTAGSEFCEECSPYWKLQEYSPKGKKLGLLDAEMTSRVYEELRGLLRKKPKYIALIAVFEREDD